MPVSDTADVTACKFNVSGPNKIQIFPYQFSDLFGCRYIIFLEAEPMGLIRYRPSTGYQLKDDFEHSIHFFWSATLPQIYRTLNHMESQGWLKAEIETQIGKPNRNGILMPCIWRENS